MKSWSVQDAKAHFSEFLRASLTHGPQLVTKHDAGVAVLVPIEEWRRLNASARPGFKALLLARETRDGVSVPERGKLRRRVPQDL